MAAWCKCSVGTVKRHLSWLEGGRVVMGAAVPSA
ncbi:hypothetical protein [Bifidobacterium longum]|nr:hypothetical protein [Bifidobacterium longum]